MPDKNDPYVENYPNLLNWLTKHGAVRMVAMPVGELGKSTGHRIECWRFKNNNMAIVAIYGDQRGWDIFTANDGGDSTSRKTFTDAEARLGLKRVIRSKSKAS
jgi:hypothetical protein